MDRHLDLDFEMLGGLMREVGFVDVVVRPFKIPVGSWPADPRLKQAGQLQQIAMLEGVESLTLGYLHEVPELERRGSAGIPCTCAERVLEEKDIHLLALVGFQRQLRRELETD